MLRKFRRFHRLSVILAACPLLIVLSATSGLSSPPEKLDVKYVYQTQKLLVEITHNSMFKGSHYIKYVEIKKNGSIVSLNTYTSQPTGDTFAYVYSIPAEDGDVFEVTATCSRGDSKTAAPLTVRTR